VPTAATPTAAEACYGNINYTRVIMGRSHLGEFEQLLLYALFRIGSSDFTSGLDVARTIEARTGRAISPGAIYTGLNRLESRRLVTSRLGEPSPQRGGKRRRLYRITPAGARVLATSHAALSEMARGLAPKLRSS
jgi:PadR family transcriptional regulator, regulatory protein PadR